MAQAETVLRYQKSGHTCVGLLTLDDHDSGTA